MGTRRDADKAALAVAQRPSQSERLPEVEHRVHDAIDLASGRAHTAPMKRPPSLEARVQRLKDVGFAAGKPIFTGPRYRLTPQRPYRASPEAWLDAFFDFGRAPSDAYFGTYGAGRGVNQIWWRVPPSFPDYWATCNFSFAKLPAGRAVMTLRFEVWPYQGATGQVVLYIGAQRTEIQITESADRTVDIGLVHNGDPVLVTMVLLQQGIYDFVFHSVLLRHRRAAHP